MDFKAIGIKALKTFVQSFLGALVITAAAVPSVSTLESAAIAGAAAALSVVQNAALAWSNS